MGAFQLKEDVQGINIILFITWIKKSDHILRARRAAKRPSRIGLRFLPPPLLQEVTTLIAHLAIQTRGTIGRSLAASAIYRQASSRRAPLTGQFILLALGSDRPSTVTETTRDHHVKVKSKG